MFNSDFWKNEVFASEESNINHINQKLDIEDKPEKSITALSDVDVHSKKNSVNTN